MAPVSAILPTITHDLNVPVEGGAWVMNAYFLLLVGSVLVIGRLGDILGHRYVFSAGVAIFGLAGVAAGLAVMIAATRVLLDVHWLSDVIAGLALGWAWFAACSIAFGGRLLRFGAPAQPAGARR
jgi:membrane-associated phospholipid phosphatase